MPGNCPRLCWRLHGGVRRDHLDGAITSRIEPELEELKRKVRCETVCQASGKHKPCADAEENVGKQRIREKKMT